MAKNIGYGPKVENTMMKNLPCQLIKKEGMSKVKKAPMKDTYYVPASAK